MLINTQKAMSIKLDNLNEVMENGLKMVLPAKPRPTPKMPRVRIYEVPEKLLILDVNGVLGHIMYTNSVPFASLSRQKLEFIIDGKQTSEYLFILLLILCYCLTQVLINFLRQFSRGQSLMNFLSFASRVLKWLCGLQKKSNSVICFFLSFMWGYI